MKILVVDDSSRLRKLIVDLLQQERREFYECSDGETALIDYQRIHPDIVLMDIAMKHLSGIEAAAQIKEYDAAAKIIIISNYDDMMLRKCVQQLGICHYILKEDIFLINDILQRELPSKH